MAGNTYTSTDLIELRGVRQRVDHYLFDLLDTGNNVVGQIEPRRDQPPTIELDTTRTVYRTLTGFAVDAEQQLALQTVSDRIRPSMVLQNGASYPLGVFLFGDATRGRRSWGLEMAATLVDAGYILAQPVGRIVGYATGTNIVQAALALAGEVITTATSITVSPQVLGSPKAYRASDTRQKICNDLLATAGYLPVYFDNSGTMVMRPVTVLPASSPDYTYEAGGRIHKDSIVETDDLLTSPNRYVVIDTNGAASAIVGTYDLPASAPNSITNRGFAVTKVIELQGLTDTSAATAAAQAAANSDDAAFKQVDFNSTHDPRHDAFNIVQLLGNQYREIAWRVELRSGGAMGHKLRRVYS